METFFSPAKINFRLKVIGQRTDGYHLLSMINGMLMLGDDVGLAITTDNDVTVEVSGIEDPELLRLLEDPARNLAARAAQLLLNHCSAECGVALVLDKCIPAGGGLGGGSSNAACVLLNLPDVLCGAGRITRRERNGLLEIAARESVTLGADVPYFMQAQSVLSHVSGIGEVVLPLPISGLHGSVVFLIVPGFGLSTAAVFGALQGREFNTEAGARREQELLENQGEAYSYEWLVQAVDNDLLQPARVVSPVMKDLFDRGQSVSSVAFMQSGSGSSFFAIPKGFNFDELAIEKELRSAFSGQDVKIIKTNLLAKPEY